MDTCSDGGHQNDWLASISHLHVNSNITTIGRGPDQDNNEGNSSNDTAYLRRVEARLLKADRTSDNNLTSDPHSPACIPPASTGSEQDTHSVEDPDEYLCQNDDPFPGYDQETTRRG
jgi:hypothetical protein